MTYDIFDSYKKRLNESVDTRFDDVAVTDCKKQNELCSEEMFDNAFNNLYGLSDSADEVVAESNLNEDFGTFPEWLKKFLQSSRAVRTSLTKKGIDLAHATYISGQLPKNARDPAFRDLTKLTVFRMHQRPDSNYQVIYIPGITDPDVYPDPLNPWTRYSASVISKKKLLELTTEYGYIDLNDSRNSNIPLRNARYTAKKGMVDRDLGAAQHAVRTNVEYAKDDRGHNDYDHPISWDIKWVTKKGYDKSGYPLDPDKYGRMLDRVGLDDYSIRLEMLYNKIEASRSRLIGVMSKYTAADSIKVRSSSWENNIFGDIQRIVADFSRAIDAYRQLEETVNELVTAEDIDNDEKDRRIKNAFQWTGKRVREYLNEVSSALKAVETAEPR